MFRKDQASLGKVSNDQASLVERGKDALGGTEFHEERAIALDTIIIIERNAFFRDCLHRSISHYCGGNISSYGSFSELAQPLASGCSTVAVLSIVNMTDEESDSELAALKRLDPLVRCMVLAETDDLDKALVALSRGANGFISMSGGVDIFVNALRFVGAGGTYVPVQCLLAAKKAPLVAPEQPTAKGITNRELAVIHAIRQGKPNKVIAYDLNMCESTVRVHVRHIMRKLHARNRTDVAIKSADLVVAGTRRETSERLASIMEKKSSARNVSEN
jgi:DNA-binding NarL/FixJ family response regulator